MNTASSAADPSTEAPLSPVSRFFNLLAVDKKEILYIWLYASFNGLVNLSLPLGIQAIINFVSGGQITISWIILVSVVILGTMFAGLMQILQVVISERIQQNIFARSAFEFAYRIPRLKIENLRNHYAPELVNRFFDTLTIQKSLSKVLIDFSTSILQIVFGLILLSFYSTYFIAFSITFGLLAFILFRVTGPPGLDASIQESKYKYQVVHWLEELARTMPTFKLSGIPAITMDKTDGMVTNYLNSRKSHFRLLMSQFIGMVTLKVLITAGLRIIGGILVINQQLNIGQFVAAEIVIVLLLNSVEKLIQSIESIYDAITATEKLGDVTDLPLEREGGTCVTGNNERKGLSIDTSDLTYMSAVTQLPIIDRVNLSIEGGENVCISGYNGSGKSTLIHILSAVYQDFEGSISYNNIPSPNIDINDLRSGIGDNFTQQDLFYGTIAENVTMGEVSVTSEKLQEALDFAGLSRFIRRLPDGFNTHIGPNGVFLSQSVIKSLILARSVIRNPILMAMEDDFYNFERLEKQRIIDYLTDEARPWTLLIVSNDPSVAKACDRVIVMKDGSVIANASSDNLQEEPWYHEIF
jgi:ABC-type bacteriocin/lantibiotic exporter with double-glycine peptidase domain